MIAVIDYGCGNPGSIVNMYKAIGKKAVITDQISAIRKADHLILPGVGAFDAGMEQLKKKGLVPVIQKLALEEKKPVLGICLGMQLLGMGSEEGKLEGLGLIPFTCVRFAFQERTDLKIPHMGWDIVRFRRQHPLLEGLQGTQRYYFVHSYHAVCQSDEHILMTCEYGYEFAAAVFKDNVTGVQFHPEKSHDFGMELLKNFAERNGRY